MKRSILHLILLMSVSLCVKAQVNAEQVLAIGRNVLGMEDYMLSIQYFNQAIKAKPYLADAYFFRGLAKLNLDDFAGAEEDCTMALSRNKFKTEAYKVRGFARQRLGKDSLAIADYNYGLQYDPTDKYFLFYKAVAQTDMQEYQAADSTFGTLLRRHNRFEEGYSARARLNLLRSDTVGALADIEKALSLSRSDINPYLMRAEILAAREEWNKALEDMDEAVRMMPEQTGLYINRAFMRYKDKDYFGAMSDYNYAISLDNSNPQAYFNRALLRFEVRDLKHAAEDFSEVLRLDPQNFHALYNRGLINLETQRYKQAQADFEAIAKKYPRFYVVYYALAECRKNLGDLKGAFYYMNKADDMVRRYVDNPKRNPLDYPVIDHRANTTSPNEADHELSDTEIMERFNRLVTSNPVAESVLTYNERIKGRVQDRDMNVELMPMYILTFIEPAQSLSNPSKSFRELDLLNRQRYIAQTIYMQNSSPHPTGEEDMQQTFETLNQFTHIIGSGEGRPIDHIAAGILHTMLKNYEAACSDFEIALKNDQDYTVALIGHAHALYMMKNISAEHTNETVITNRHAQAAIADLDHALRINPRLAYAWYNKGNMLYESGDYTSAIQSYSEALNTDPYFGEGYYNRGIAYLKAGNIQQAFSDLSKAGELGIIPSYNLLKRLK